MAKAKYPVRRGSTKKKQDSLVVRDGDSLVVREIKNLVFAETRALAAEISETQAELRRLTNEVRAVTAIPVPDRTPITPITGAPNFPYVRNPSTPAGTWACDCGGHHLNFQTHDQAIAGALAAIAAIPERAEVGDIAKHTRETAEFNRSNGWRQGVKDSIAHLQSRVLLLSGAHPTSGNGAIRSAIEHEITGLQSALERGSFVMVPAVARGR